MTYDLESRGDSSRRSPFDLEGAFDRETTSATSSDLFRDFTPAERAALAFTSKLETGHEFGLGGATGNFDGYGVSIGLMQWNIGSGSLQPMLLRFIERHPTRWAAVFGQDAQRFKAILQLKAEQKPRIAAQLKFAVEEMNHLVYSKKKKKQVYVLRPEWKRHFDQLVAEPGFKAIEVEEIRKNIGRAADYARELGLESQRALIMSFDATAWPGPYWLKHKKLRAAVYTGFAARAAAKGSPLTELEKLSILAEIFGNHASAPWRDNALARKRAIVTGASYKGAQVPPPAISDLPFTSSAPPTRAPASLSGDSLGMGGLLVVEGAIVKHGENASEITNAVFHLRHPERNRTPIAKGETAAIAEWWTLREGIVASYLVRRKAPPLPKGSVVSKLAVVSKHGLFNKRTSPMKAVKGVVVHTTGSGPAIKARESNRTAIDIALAYYTSGYGPHYTIHYDGTIFVTQDERMQAWHAGYTKGEQKNAPCAWWTRAWGPHGFTHPRELLPKGDTSPNQSYLGIEILADRGERGFTDAQYRSLALLLRDIGARHGIEFTEPPSRTLLGHEDVNPWTRTGPAAKPDCNGQPWDPGGQRTPPKFSWSRVGTLLGGSAAKEIADHVGRTTPFELEALSDTQERYEVTFLDAESESAYAEEEEEEEEAPTDNEVSDDSEVFAVAEEEELDHDFEATDEEDETTDDEAFEHDIAYEKNSVYESDYEENSDVASVNEENFESGEDEAPSEYEEDEAADDEALDEESALPDDAELRDEVTEHECQCGASHEAYGLEGEHSDDEATPDEEYEAAPSRAADVDERAAEPPFSPAIRGAIRDLLPAKELAAAVAYNRKLHPAISGVAIDALLRRLDVYIDRAKLLDTIRRANTGGASYATDDLTVASLAAHQFQQRCFAKSKHDGYISEGTLDALGFVWHKGHDLNPWDKPNATAQGHLNGLPAAVFTAHGDDVTAKTWFQRIVNPAFLGYRFGKGIHLELLRSLRKAQAHLMTLASYRDLDPVALGAKLGIAEDHKGARPEPNNKTSSMHTLGLAVDIAYKGNPWVAGKSKSANQNKAFRNVMKRASLLVGGAAHDLSPAWLHGLGSGSIPTATIYDEVKRRHDVFRTYLLLSGDSAALRKHLAARKVAATKGVFLQGENVDQAVTRWSARIRTDRNVMRTVLLGQGVVREPTSGFLNLHRDLVVALRDHGCLAWGAVDLGEHQSGDMMHFDCRATGLGRAVAPPAGYSPKSGHPCIEPGAATSKTLKGLRRFTSDITKQDVAVFVPSGIAPSGPVDVLVFLHGLREPCGVKSYDPALPITGAEFDLGRIVAASGRSVVLVVPSLRWDKSSKSSPLSSPAKMNALVDEVLAHLPKAGRSQAPSLGKLLLAGHSKAYVVLNGLANDAGSDAFNQGALSKLSEVWSLDSMYVPSCSSWLSWARKRPNTYFHMVYTVDGGTLGNTQCLARALGQLPKKAGATCPCAPGSAASVTNMNVQLFPGKKQHCAMVKPCIAERLSAVSQP